VGQQARQHRLGEHHGAAQVDAIDGVEVGEIDFVAPDVGLAGDAGAVYQAMNAAEGPLCLVQGTGDRGGVDDVGGACDGLPIGRGNDRSRLFSAVVIAIDARDRDALRAQEQCLWRPMPLAAPTTTIEYGRSGKYPDIETSRCCGCSRFRFIGRGTPRRHG
jgi:hypothetical protein